MFYQIGSKNMHFKIQGTPYKPMKSDIDNSEVNGKQ